MIAALYGSTDRRAFLGALTAAQILDACGRRPSANNYRGDTQGYRQDLADYNTCVKSATPKPAASAPAAAPAPPPTGDDAIATSALAWMSTIGAGPGTSLYNSWKAQIMSALSAGILDPGGQYATSTGKCSGASAPAGPNEVQLAAQATGVVSAGATVAHLVASTVSVIPIIGIGASVAGLFISLFSKLFGPPVSQLEQKTLCPAVSATNAILRQIHDELQAGYITTDQAVSALNELVGQFNSQVASIEYIQTPNDTQFMMSSLGALQNKLANVVYPPLGQQASAAKATQQAQAAAAQQAQIDAEVQKAVAAALPPTPAPAPVAQPVATPAPAPAKAPLTIPAGSSVTPAPAAPSWFTGETTIGSFEVPDWALLVGAGILVMAVM